MPITGAENLRSAGGVPFLPLGPGVTPNSDHDIEWLTQAGWGYSGIETFSSPVTDVVVTSHIYRRYVRLRARKRNV